MADFTLPYAINPGPSPPLHHPEKPEAIVWPDASEALARTYYPNGGGNGEITDLESAYDKLEKVLSAAQGLLSIISWQHRGQIVSNLVVPRVENEKVAFFRSSAVSDQQARCFDIFLDIPVVRPIYNGESGSAKDRSHQLGVGEGMLIIPLFYTTIWQTVERGESEVVTSLDTISVDSDRVRSKIRPPLRRAKRRGLLIGDDYKPTELADLLEAYQPNGHPTTR